MKRYTATVTLRDGRTEDFLVVGNMPAQAIMQAQKEAAVHFELSKVDEAMARVALKEGW